MMKPIDPIEKDDPLDRAAAELDPELVTLRARELFELTDAALKHREPRKGQHNIVGLIRIDLDL